MNILSNLTTATEIQRNYKSVSKRARTSGEALIVMLNNKPDLAVMKYDLYQHLIDKGTNLLALAGTWTKKEADKFNKIVDEMNERIDLEDWK